ncbi:MAG: PcfJ domain-containing protein [Clostridia bacterium]|nr:PcfJ domain-containing protein [Clostridia bacterium]
MMEQAVKLPNIRPIPQRIFEKIKKEDIRRCPQQKSATRFYAYLTRIKGKLAKITVGVKTYKKQWYCKQVVVHIVNDKYCYVGDMILNWLGGYIVDWHFEIPSMRMYYRYSGWGWSGAKGYDPDAPIVNINYMRTFPEYKYSGYQQLQTSHLIQFISQYEKYPVIEFLMKFGYYNFWMSKQICELATKDKGFRKWLVRQRNVKGINYYYVSSIINAYKRNRDVTQQEQIERAKKEFAKSDYKELRQAFTGEREKFLAYLEKQGTSIANYRDYYKACTELDMDMSIPRNRYPHDFRYWHDVRIDQYHTKLAEEDAKKRAELYAKFSSVIEKYTMLERNKGEGYVVIIAQSPAELIKEGNALNHCVGRCNYDQKVAREESLIFFVRRTSEIDVPFVTMEYSIPTSVCFNSMRNTTPNHRTRCNHSSTTNGCRMPIRK